ncbi:MAG: hypothetical protein GX559_00945 [Candidatus Pacebacteria bacterium]|nr:hypothetical protein [Candidatus Paceibacterota bacterium]
MRKEVLLAILVGASLGLLITFAVYRSQRNVSDAQKDQVQDVISSQSADEQESSGQLAITSPEDNLIVDSQRLIVSGNTQANNSVVIALNDLEIITNADASGNFSKEIRLDQGANVLSIYSISQDGLLTRVDRTVIVDEEFLNEDFSEQEAEATGEKTPDEEQAEADKQN